MYYAMHADSPKASGFEFLGRRNENAGVEVTKVAKPVKSALKDSRNVGDHCTRILCDLQL